MQVSKRALEGVCIMDRNAAKSWAKVVLGILLAVSATQMIPGFRLSETAKAQGPQPDDWWMFRHDMNRTGNTTSTAPNTNNILWTHQTVPTGYTWGYCGSPAVAGGLVFQGGNRPDVFRAIDAETGIQSWPFNTGDRVTTSPTVADNRVLFASYDNNLYARVPNTGAESWTRNMGVDIDSSPTVYEGKVYIGSGRGDYVATDPKLLYCLDEANGDIIWTFQAQGQIISSPTIVDDTVIFGSYDENVYALPAEDPTPGDGSVDISEAIWVFNAGTRVVSSAAVEDGVVYIGGWNGKLYALPLIDPNGDGTIETDEVIWEFSTGNEIWSSPGIARGRIFIGSHDNCLYALPKEDPNGDGVISASEVLWKFQTTDKVWSSPSIAGGKVFISSEDYTIWAVCEETGEYIWHYTMPLQNDPYGSELLYASASIVNGKVYVGNYDLTLYCFGDDADTTLPTVTGIAPINNSENVSPNSDIEAVFSEDLCEVLITDSCLTVETESGSAVSGQMTYNDITRTLTFNPDSDLLPDEHYTVRLRSRHFQDAAGNTLDGNENNEIDLPPQDDYIWHFNTSHIVGHKPSLSGCCILPEEGHISTLFDIYVTFTDEDGDVPVPPEGYVRVFMDGSTTGVNMSWANNTNIPESHLLDGDCANGELFHAAVQFDFVGDHEFYIECSDGANSNSTPVYFLPTVLNAPPELSIPTQHVYEDAVFTLNLSNHVYDLDNDTADLTFCENSEHCEIVDDHFLVFYFADDDASFEEVEVSANDGINNVSQNVLFIMDPSDDPPALKEGLTALPSATVTEDSLFVFDLGDYVTDPDTPEELISVSADSENVIPVGFELYMLYPLPVAYENVSLTISDGSTVLELYLRVYILPVNDPPVLKVPQLILTEDIPIYVDLGEYITDEESDISGLELRVTSEALGELDVSSGMQLELCYFEGITADILNITVIDGDVETSREVRATITPVNDAPSLRTPRAERVFEENKTVYNFLVWYDDEDLKTEFHPEPHVELILNDDCYSLVILQQKDPPETGILYGITLELEEEMYLYHFQCDDCAGEGNSRNSTSILTLDISGDGGEREGDKETTSERDTAQPCLIGFLFILIVILLILINLWMVYSRQRHKGQPPTQHEGEDLPSTSEKESLEKDEKLPPPPEDYEPLPPEGEEPPPPPEDYEPPPPEDNELPPPPEDYEPSKPEGNELPPPPDEHESLAASGGDGK